MAGNRTILSQVDRSSATGPTPRDRSLSTQTFKIGRRPEIEAGGFARDNSTIAFLVRVNALLEPGMRVLDLGPGRGSAFKGPDTFKRRLAKIQGKVQWVIGIDVDDAIMQHPYLDERHVVAMGSSYPVEDRSIDLVMSDWVLEHVADPPTLAAELARILKPGGWFVARTPNKWGYVGIAARLVPNAFHQSVLARVSPGRHEEDMFPTVYRMNTKRTLRRYLLAPDWQDFSYTVSSTPQYHGNSRLLFGLISYYQRLMPQALGTDLIVLFRKS